MTGACAARTQIGRHTGWKCVPAERSRDEWWLFSICLLGRRRSTLSWSSSAVDDRWGSELIGPWGFASLALRSRAFARAPVAIAATIMATMSAPTQIATRTSRLATSSCPCRCLLSRAWSRSRPVDSVEVALLGRGFLTPLREELSSFGLSAAANEQNWLSPRGTAVKAATPHVCARFIVARRRRWWRPLGHRSALAERRMAGTLDGRCVPALAV